MLEFTMVDCLLIEAALADVSAEVGDIPAIEKLMRRFETLRTTENLKLMTV